MIANDSASLPVPFPRATIELSDSEIPSILKCFRSFVGKERLERRIELADKMIASASPTYRAQFVRPRQSLWTGTRELIRLVESGLLGREHLTPTAVVSLHYMATIRNVVHTMPSWKKAEFRSRLTDKVGGDIPALVEIIAASRIVTLGGSVKWIPENDRGRTFEMLVSYKGQKLEVECKAKSVDAGRKVARGDFYQFADSLLVSEAVRNLTRADPRYVVLVTSGRFPHDHVGQSMVRRAIEALITSGGLTDLPDGSTLSVEKITAAEMKNRASAPLQEFEHRLVRPELVLSIRSRRPDQMIANIENELKDGLKQLTGSLPSALVCYVPEVQSFEGILDPRTATTQLVQRFLSRDDAQQVVSIAFVSEPVIDRRTGEVETGLPSVRYVANKFRASQLGKF